MKKDIFLTVLILVTSIFLSLPLLKQGLHQIHDDQQVARLYLFDQSLKSGQFPVRWVDELGFGYGYPLFVFYPPLVYMVGETFHLLGFGFIDSIKLVFFTSIFASGIAMYILGRTLLGRVAGFVAAMFYIVIPYRALDIYVRGALAESFSFVWLPLILWAFYKLNETKKFVYIFLSAIFLALLMLTHNLIFLPFMLLLPFYLLVLLINSGDKKYFILHTLYSILLCFGLSAFFWIPALAEKKYTIVDDLLLVNLANYRIHFVALSQLWNWPWGFGGSAAGLADGISFKIGKLHVLVSVAAFILSVIFFLKYKANSYLSIVTCRKTTRPCQLSIVLCSLLVASAFMTTSYSSFVWQIIPPLGYLQFPWRFLTFVALFSSILAGFFIYSLKFPTLRLVASILMALLLIIPNYKLFKSQAYRFDMTDEIATSKQILNWDISHSSFEYIPKGIPLVISELGTNVPDIQKENIPEHKIEIIEGKATSTELTSNPSKTSFIADARQATQFTANIFNFPGWQVSVDGQKVSVEGSRLKLIKFSVPEGIHKVEVEFKNTPIRSIANLITLMSILITPLAWRRLRTF